MKRVLLFLGLIILPFSMISNVKAENYASDTLKGKAVTSGDGIYLDKYNDGRYVYKGGNPNNFIKFNNELWRIISVEKDGTLKIIRLNPLDNPTTDMGENVAYNDSNSLKYGTYCSAGYNSNGCNAWGKSDYYDGGKGTNTSNPFLKGTVTEDSLINKYLNNKYYETLNNESKCKITSNDYYFGSVGENYDDTIEQTITEERKQTWNGNIALANVSDILLATTDEGICGTVGSIRKSIYGIDSEGNKKLSHYVGVDSTFACISSVSCISDCSQNDYLLPSKKYSFTDYSYLLLNGVYNSNDSVFGAAYHGLDNQIVGSMESQYNFKYNIRPVTYLRSDMEIVSGDGTDANPYELSCDECDIKNNDTDSNMVVNVPPTSMFISVFIIGGFILIILICLIIYLKVFKKKDIK